MTLRVIVIAAGDGTRWGGHLGVEKHFVPVDGERLLDRTVRLFSPYGEVLIAGKDERYVIPGATTFFPETNTTDGVDKFLNSADRWNPDGRTIVAYGDVYFTDEAVQTMVDYQDREWRLFARPHGSKLTGRPFGECFAQSFWPEHHEEHLEALYRCGEVFTERTGGWEHYLQMCGRTDYPDPMVRDRMIVIDDWTDDFDYPIDYERFLAARAVKGKKA